MGWLAEESELLGRLLLCALWAPNHFNGKHNANVLRVLNILLRFVIGYILMHL